MKKALLITGSFIIVILITVASLYWRSKSFQIVHPRIGDITEAVYGLGKVKSQNRFEVIIGVISTVKERFANEGDRIHKGMPLIQFEDGALFRAPFEGTVTYVALYPGETALPNVPIMRLEDLDHKYIEISLEQQSILRVRPGQNAKVSFESLRGQVLTGKVTAIYPREDEFLTRVDVENLDKNILSGMTADVSIEIGSIQNVLLVPLNSVVNGSIDLRRDHRWQKVKVEVGHVDGNWAEIQNSNLSPEDELRMKAGPE